ncbi:hypothetical protein GJ496_004957 [Pomphorhynchus laevis]|nr:hypothetical protein GJ496_004957 [Pomphorhynchus laevis]
MKFLFEDNFNDLLDIKITDGPFIYTEKQRATLLAAFFYGYLITEIPGGILAGKFGSMIPMAAGTALNSLSAWHYVSAAKHSYGLFVFTRVLVGCGSGVILPCASNVWTKWAPVSEKSFLIAIATSGAHIAPIFILPLGGYLCKASGWEAIFYVTASIELLWILLWLIFFRDTPQKSWITPQREKDYILKHLDTVRVETNELSAPWKAILTSKHCWGLFLTHTCANWGFYTLLTETPSYFSNVLYLDTSKSGFVSAIPYVIIWFTTTLSSFLADYLFRKNIIKNRTVIRKIAVMMGTWIPGIFLIALGFVKCSQQNLAILLLALGQGLFGITWGAGHMCNANDIVPVHAGVVFGISNTFATLPGILTPYVTAVLTPQNTQKQWQIVFSLSAAIMMMGGVIFLFLGSGNPEIWDSDDNVPPHRGSITRMM